jgi:lipopolysaccharide transport system permease protein
MHNTPVNNAAQQVEPTIIEPRAGWAPPRLAELWRFRELLFFFVWRDIKVRYKQTLLGATWAIIQPVATTVVFALFFGRLAKVPSEGEPYILFALTGLALWTFFGQALNGATQSLVGAAGMITKIYFPRLLTPIAAVASYLIDLLIAFVVAVVVVLAYGRPLSFRIVAVIPFSLLAFAAAVGVGLFGAALNVRYRDVKYALPFLIQLWLFCSPVAYPSTLLSGWKRVIFGINPMTSAIDGFRWAVLGTTAPPLGEVAVSVAITLGALALGVAYFSRVESTFADVI